MDMMPIVNLFNEWHRNNMKTRLSKMGVLEKSDTFTFDLLKDNVGIESWRSGFEFASFL